MNRIKAHTKAYKHKGWSLFSVLCSANPLALELCLEKEIASRIAQASLAKIVEWQYDFRMRLKSGMGPLENIGRLLLLDNNISTYSKYR